MDLRYPLRRRFSNAGMTSLSGSDPDPRLTIASQDTDSFNPLRHANCEYALDAECRRAQPWHSAGVLDVVDEVDRIAMLFVAGRESVPDFERMLELRRHRERCWPR